MTGFSRDQKSKGFTLIEVLIVLVILGILAGSAIPIFRTAIERVRKAEALAFLSSIRQSELRFFAEKGIYTGTIGDLDFDPNLPIGGQVHHFEYTVESITGQGFLITATRNAVDNPGDFAGKSVTINQKGEVGGTYK